MGLFDIFSKIKQKFVYKKCNFNAPEMADQLTAIRATTTFAPNESTVYDKNDVHRVVITDLVPGENGNHTYRKKYMDVRNLTLNGKFEDTGLPKYVPKTFYFPKDKDGNFETDEYGNIVIKKLNPGETAPVGSQITNFRILRTYEDMCTTQQAIYEQRLIKNHSAQFARMTLPDANGEMQIVTKAGKDGKKHYVTARDWYNTELNKLLEQQTDINEMMFAVQDFYGHLKKQVKGIQKGTKGGDSEQELKNVEALLTNSKISDEIEAAYGSVLGEYSKFVDVPVPALVLFSLASKGVKFDGNSSSYAEAMKVIDSIKMDDASKNVSTQETFRKMYQDIVGYSIDESGKVIEVTDRKFDIPGIGVTLDVIAKNIKRTSENETFDFIKLLTQSDFQAKFEEIVRTRDAAVKEAQKRASAGDFKLFTAKAKTLIEEKLTEQEAGTQEFVKAQFIDAASMGADASIGLILKAINDARTNGNHGDYQNIVNGIIDKNFAKYGLEDKVLSTIKPKEKNYEFNDEVTMEMLVDSYFYESELMAKVTMELLEASQKSIKPMITKEEREEAINFVNYAENINVAMLEAIKAKEQIKVTKKVLADARFNMADNFETIIEVKISEIEDAQNIRISNIIQEKETVLSKIQSDYNNDVNEALLKNYSNNVRNEYINLNTKVGEKPSAEVIAEANALAKNEANSFREQGLSPDDLLLALSEDCAKKYNGTQIVVGKRTALDYQDIIYGGLRDRENNQGFISVSSLEAKRNLEMNAADHEVERKIGVDNLRTEQEKNNMILSLENDRNKTKGEESISRIGILERQLEDLKMYLDNASDASISKVAERNGALEAETVNAEASSEAVQIITDTREAILETIAELEEEMSSEYDQLIRAGFAKDQKDNKYKFTAKGAEYSNENCPELYAHLNGIVDNYAMMSVLSGEDKESAMEVVSDFYATPESRELLPEPILEILDKETLTDEEKQRIINDTYAKIQAVNEEKHQMLREAGIDKSVCRTITKQIIEGRQLAKGKDAEKAAEEIAEEISHEETPATDALREQVDTGAEAKIEDEKIKFMSAKGKYTKDGCENAAKALGKIIKKMHAENAKTAREEYYKAQAAGKAAPVAEPQATATPEEVQRKEAGQKLADMIAKHAAEKATREADEKNAAADAEKESEPAPVAPEKVETEQEKLARAIYLRQVSKASTKGTVFGNGDFAKMTDEEKNQYMMDLQELMAKKIEASGISGDVKTAILTKLSNMTDKDGKIVGYEKLLASFHMAVQQCVSVSKGAKPGDARIRVDRLEKLSEAMERGSEITELSVEDVKQFSVGDLAKFALSLGVLDEKSFDEGTKKVLEALDKAGIKAEDFTEKTIDQVYKELKENEKSKGVIAELSEDKLNEKVTGGKLPEKVVKPETSTEGQKPEEGKKP